MPIEDWEYRVLEFIDPDETIYRQIHQVELRDGVPVTYNDGAAIIQWDAEVPDDEPKKILDKMREALDKPVLVEKDFRTGDKPND